MVRHKVRRVVWIVLCHKEELTDGGGTKGKHGHAELTQGLPLQYHAPQLHAIPEILLMAEILHQLIGSLSHYLQGFIHPRWLFGISAINSMGVSN